jgi:hypothetical protein
VHPQRQVDQHDLGGADQSFGDRILTAQAVDHPPVLRDDLGMPARIIGFRRQLPTGLPEQHFDQRKPAVAREMTRKRRLASRRIADDDDPCQHRRMG